MITLSCIWSFYKLIVQVKQSDHCQHHVILMQMGWYWDWENAFQIFNKLLKSVQYAHTCTWVIKDIAGLVLRNVHGRKQNSKWFFNCNHCGTNFIFPFHIMYNKSRPTWSLRDIYFSFAGLMNLHVFVLLSIWLWNCAVWSILLHLFPIDTSGIPEGNDLYSGLKLLILSQNSLKLSKIPWN